ncbi:MAG TPA: type II CRISPR-associated endonuclease Cas1 [Kiritimatiellia bacterium]|mgnify:CR=1 FL=1|nr:type II CRISPR-associated endonuclease Cas1 [Kiritimatiellia bacterium]
MLKRTIDISEGPAFLRVENRQLVIEKNREVAGMIPCEDIGMLIVASRAVTMTTAVAEALCEAGSVVVFCGCDNMPSGMLLPLEGHHLPQERLNLQIGAKLPAKKRMWASIVSEKLRRQARNLPDDHVAARQILALVKKIRSGDPENVEGQASRAYWPAFLGGDFRRDPKGLPPNNLLNYGYAILRAATARAIVTTGLHPGFGLHHHNRANAFCLADDLMEPFRPWVDEIARQLYVEGWTHVTKPVKAAMLGLLSQTVYQEDQSSPLTIALQRFAFSYVSILAGKEDALIIPDWKYRP